MLNAIRPSALFVPMATVVKDDALIFENGDWGTHHFLS